MDCHFQNPLRSAQINPPTGEEIKGFLYKIKNEQDKTIGYLFGTVHEISIKKPVFHEKICKALSRSQTLFLEDSTDENAAEEYLKKSDLVRLFPNVKEIAKQMVEEFKSKQNCTESLLCAKADSFGLKIKSLETEDSRKKAEESVEADYELFEITKKFLIWRAAAQAAKRVQKIMEIDQAKIQKPEIDEIFEHLIEGYQFLSYAIKENNYNKSHPTYEIFRLVDTYDLVFKTFGLDPKFIGALKTLFIAEKERQENQTPERNEKLELLWKLGDEKAYNEMFENKEDKEIKCKEMHIRDEFMVQQIHNDLLQSSGLKRSFYAIGYGHLLGNYENLKKMLEKKGWKIVKAYKD